MRHPEVLTNRSKKELHGVAMYIHQGGTECGQYWGVGQSGGPVGMCLFEPGDDRGVFSGQVVCLARIAGEVEEQRQLTIRRVCSPALRRGLQSSIVT